MFRVIHPNRWFIWTLILLLIANFILLFFIEKALLEFERDALQSAISYTRAWKTYRSDILGFSVTYPQTWQIEIDPLEENTLTLQNPENFGENISISVTTPELESVIRDSFGFDQEQKVTIGGYEGALLHNSDENDSATRNIVLVEVEGQLFYIAGTAQVFDRVAQSMTFLQK